VGAVAVAVAVTSTVRGAGGKRPASGGKPRPAAPEKPKVALYGGIAAAAVLAVGLIVTGMRGGKEEEPSGTGILSVASTEQTVEPEPAPVVVTAPPTPPTSNSPPPTESANQEPSTKNQELLTIPGLVPRLEAYLAARREELDTLATGYERGLDGRLEQTAAAGDLAVARALREEKARGGELRRSLAEAPGDPFAAAGAAATLPALP